MECYSPKTGMHLQVFFSQSLPWQTDQWDARRAIRIDGEGTLMHLADGFVLSISFAVDDAIVESLAAATK